MPEHKQILRLSSPAEIVDVVPYLIGFRPSQSLVAVGMRPHGSTFRSAVTLRSDLPARESIWPFAEHVLSFLARHKAARALLVSYDESGERGYDRQLFDAFQKQADLHGIAVNEALVVRAGTWWSALCSDRRCCPPDGTPIDPAPGAAELTAITAGLVAEPSRDILAGSIKPVSEIIQATMDQALDEAAADVATLLAEPGGRPRLRSRSMTLIRALLDRHTATAPVRPTHLEAARTLLGLGDLGLRDECMRWTHGRRGDAALALWTELTRLSPPPLGASVATLLAYVWWQRGHGAMANVALDRALAHDPAYTMANLLLEAMQCGIRPEKLNAARILGSGRPARRSRGRSASGRGKQPAR